MAVYVRPASLTPRNESERFSPPGGPDKSVKTLKKVESGRVEQQLHDVGSSLRIVKTGKSDSCTPSDLVQPYPSSQQFVRTVANL